jgi:hypothetical protein
MTPEFARTLFAAFPAELREAMKDAAARNGWVAEDWVWHVEQVQTVMRRGGWTAAKAAECYRGPVKLEEKSG